MKRQLDRKVVRCFLLGMLLSTDALLFPASVRAATYNAVNDFSVSNGNPNGVWSYGTLSSVPGGTFTLFNTSGSTATEQSWTNGQTTIPNTAIVRKNTTGSTIQDGPTIFIPPDVLRLDGQSFTDVVRWTAPSTGIYDITGRFQRIDDLPSPVNISIIENSTNSLFTDFGFTTYGSNAPYEIDNLTIPAGTTLDFVEQPDGSPDNDSTGLAVSITSVPEPALLAAVLPTLSAIFLRRRRLIA